MKKYFILLFACIFLFGFSFSIKHDSLSYTPKDGFVPDAKTAVKIAEIILNSVYGKKNINYEKPLRATLSKDSTIWTVSGTLPEDAAGGVAVIKLQKVDCKVIFLEHGK